MEILLTLLIILGCSVIVLLILAALYLGILLVGQIIETIGDIIS